MLVAAGAVADLQRPQHHCRAHRDVTIPIRLDRAGADELLTQPSHAERVHEHLRRAHEYVVVPDAGHYAFLAPFPRELKQKIGSPAEDPPGFDRAAFHSRLNAELLAFFAKSLSGS